MAIHYFKNRNPEQVSFLGPTHARLPQTERRQTPPPTTQRIEQDIYLAPKTPEETGSQSKPGEE